MIQTKNRKEITLDAQTLSILQIQAEKQGRKLKNYMEYNKLNIAIFFT